MTIRVGILGANGRMGQMVVDAVRAQPDLALCAAADVEDDLAALVSASVDVAVDFTHPDAVMSNLRFCVEHGIDVVVGTSGFDAGRIEDVRLVLAGNPDVGVVIAANFGIGAVLMARFAAEASPFFESVEIVELHHPGKADAPSGTAVDTARRIADARSEAGCDPVPDATTHELPGARGAQVNGVRVHSVRLRGLVAHQEVLLGAPGETLTIRHDAFDRVSFMPGVLLAVRAVGSRPGLTLGIDDLI